MEIGDRVRVNPKACRGSIGPTHKIIDKKEKMPYSSATGPWLLLEEVGRKHRRWIHETQDDDFALEIV